MKRKRFLKEFLGALGAKEIIYTTETVLDIFGINIYDLNSSEERQDFVWHISEDNVPNEDVYKLAKLLNDEKLLSIDMITISKEKLLEAYNDKFKVSLKQDEFNLILEELESVEVSMIDDGIESDFYFIHE